VYLAHWPLFLWLTRARIGWHGWPLTTLRFAVAIAAGTLSYWLVERPVRRGALSTPTFRVVIPVAVVVSYLCVLLATR
jgi:peptidoglycan/LPS O-acetylase OafA/YrhL